MPFDFILLDYNQANKVLLTRNDGNVYVLKEKLNKKTFQ